MYKCRREFSQIFVTESGIMEGGERTDFSNSLKPEPDDLVGKVIDDYNGDVEIQPVKGHDLDYVISLIKKTLR
ncbi:hypothetical protein GCM10009128_12680 [Psychrosphaera haliotis]|uniref:hypothetical protein n=1 Tax=Psychrosphaera haliotis TaxID=555083 RepID=UPI0031D4D607